MLPGIIFGLTAFLLLILILKENIEFSKRLKKVQELYRSKGKEWAYWSDFNLRIKFRTDPNTIFSSDDDASIKDAKTQVINQRKRMFQLLPRSIIIMVCGLILTFIASIISKFFN